MTRITFVHTKKNLDDSERELYEMDLALRALHLDRAFADLGLLTVAACTPPDVDVVHVDEYVQPIDYGLETTAVALSAKTSCVSRVYETAGRFRDRGIPVILGGIHASLRPEEALEHVDCVVTGEAEGVWPTVVRDLQAGRLRQRYDARGFPEMKGIPVPDWSRSPVGRYFFQQLQTTRGCPYRCRFCSVPDIAGNDFRFKPIEGVLQELINLPRPRGIAGPNRPLYIVDDNFLSRSRYTKDLLRAMIPMAEAGQLPPWSAETTLNVATDEELLDLLVLAGCDTLIIGLESIEEATLQSMDKGINFCLTFPEAIERIHQRGLTVVGNFIVGFDTDDLGVFVRLRDFIRDTGILYPFFSILTPMPGTGLFDDFDAAGRLDHHDWHLYDTRHVVMQPAQMSQEQLMDGYIWLYEQCYRSDDLLDRLERHWKRRTNRKRIPVAKAFVSAQLAREAVRGDDVMRHLVRRGVRMLLSRRLSGEPGNLLLTLDATDFAGFLHRFKSPRYQENSVLFERPDRVLASPTRAQWDNAKARMHTARSA